MADHAAGDDIFVYTGGRAPLHVVNAIIDESVEEIDEEAFYNNRNLRSVACHDRVLTVGQWGFCYCHSLQRVKMPGVKIIEPWAFYNCISLVNVDFGSKLETIGGNAFTGCTSLKRINLPKLKAIGQSAFMDSGVEDAELGADLETIGSGAFRGSKLRRIAIPLKDGMFQLDDLVEAYNQFRECYNLATIDLVGGIHKTVASLHLESWRDEMNEEIQRINQVLPGAAHDEKADEIVQWIRSVINKVEHYKAEHSALLELALWKAKLAGFNVVGNVEEKAAKKAKIDVGEARKEARITSGADIIIKNVLPYLKME